MGLDSSLGNRISSSSISIKEEAPIVLVLKEKTTIVDEKKETRLTAIISSRKKVQFPGHLQNLAGINSYARGR